MKLISLIIIAIGLLIVIPTAYFCFTKILDRNTQRRTAVLAGVIFVVVAVLVVFVGGNAYTFFINSEEGIVAERYTRSLIENTIDGDIETHKRNTEAISYELERLDWVYSSTENFDFEEMPRLKISESRWTDEEGATYLYILLDEEGICYDIALKKQGYFWDVYSINIVENSKLGLLLGSERFLPLR